MKITLKGGCPSKKNSRIVVCRGLRPLILPGKFYQAWHEEQMWVLKKDRPPEPIDKAKIQMTFYPKTLLKADLSNKAESVMDLLVDAGYLKDDNWYVCDSLILIFGGLDRENPRVEVEIN